MKQIAAIISAVFLCVILVPAVQAQSLADVAKKEQERREQISETPKEITNDDAADYSGGSVSTIEEPATKPDSESAEESSEESSDGKENGETADQDEPVDFKGRTESYWRQTMTEARNKVKSLEEKATSITLKLNELENQFYSIDDGFDRDGVQREIQKSYYEQDLNKENLAKAKEELEELEIEARKSGALPGWIE